MEAVARDEEQRAVFDVVHPALQRVGLVRSKLLLLCLALLPESVGPGLSRGRGLGIGTNGDSSGDKENHENWNVERMFGPERGGVAA